MRDRPELHTIELVGDFEKDDMLQITYKGTTVGQFICVQDVTSSVEKLRFTPTCLSTLFSIFKDLDEYDE